MQLFLSRKVNSINLFTCLVHYLFYISRTLFITPPLMHYSSSLSLTICLRENLGYTFKIRGETIRFHPFSSLFSFIYINYSNLFLFHVLIVLSSMFISTLYSQMFHIILVSFPLDLNLSWYYSCCSAGFRGDSSRNGNSTV